MFLSQILANGQDAIASVSTLIATGLLKLDATGVSNLTEEEIEALFSAIPIEFKLEKILIEDTVSNSLREQVTDYINQRQRKKIKSVKEPSSSYNVNSNSVNSSENKMLSLPSTEDSEQLIDDTTPEAIPTDIFSLRDEVIKDYRGYIEGFLNIRDEKIKGFVKTALDPTFRISKIKTT